MLLNSVDSSVREMSDTERVSICRFLVWYALRSPTMLVFSKKNIDISNEKCYIISPNFNTISLYLFVKTNWRCF